MDNQNQDSSSDRILSEALEHLAHLMGDAVTHTNGRVHIYMNKKPMTVVGSFGSVDVAYSWYRKEITGRLPVNRPKSNSLDVVQRADRLIGSRQVDVTLAGSGNAASGQAPMASTSTAIEKAQAWQDNMRWLVSHRDARIKQVRRLRSVSDAFVDSVIVDAHAEHAAATQAVASLDLDRGGSQHADLNQTRHVG